MEDSLHIHISCFVYGTVLYTYKDCGPKCNAIYHPKRNSKFCWISEMFEKDE